jgi:hypothetical protein
VRKREVGSAHTTTGFPETYFRAIMLSQVQKAGRVSIAANMSIFLTLIVCDEAFSQLMSEERDSIPGERVSGEVSSPTQLTLCREG